MSELFLRRSSTFLFQGPGGGGVELLATRGVEQGDVLGPLLFSAAFRRSLETLRERLLDVLVNEFGLTREAAEAELVLGAYLDDVLVGLPAAVAARVPGLATEAFELAGCVVEEGETKV